jgi:hypothetical protein
MLLSLGSAVGSNIVVGGGDPRMTTGQAADRRCSERQDYSEIVTDGRNSLIEAGEPVLPSVETTRYTAEQWKSRALYEEACKLSAERALTRAMDVLRDALFAAAHVRADLDEDPQIDRHLRPVDGTAQA